MADISAVANEFVSFYYTTFDTNRSGLANLYRPQSMLTWEDSQLLGVQSISDKLTGLPFKEVKHVVSKCDAQPSSPTIASIIVLVTGFLQVDGEANQIPFSQTFQLIPENGSYWVYNDIFRLNLG